MYNRPSNYLIKSAVSYQFVYAFRGDRALRASVVQENKRRAQEKAECLFFAFIQNLFSQCYVGATHKTHPRTSVAKVMALIPQPIKRPKESKKPNERL